MVSRRWRAATLAVLALTTTLAGCTDTTPDPDDDGPPPAPFTAVIPRWDLGDAWTYTVKTAEFPETSSTMLVYGDDGNNYEVGVTDRREALVHALFNVNPQLGRIQKGNLAVYEKGEPRAMYRFPIADGDTWDTDLFVSVHGGRLTATATYDAAIATAMGPMEGFAIEARNSNGFSVVYDYVPAIQWFSKLVVKAADGTLLHDLRVTSHERGLAGTAWFVRGDDLFEESFGPATSGVQTWTRPVLVDGASAKGGRYGPYDVLAYNVRVLVPSGQNHKADVSIVNPDGTTVYQRSFLTTQSDEFRFETRDDPKAGQWEVRVTLTGQATAAVRLAGAWEYSGTV